MERAQACIYFTGPFASSAFKREPHDTIDVSKSACPLSVRGHSEVRTCEGHVRKDFWDVRVPHAVRAQGPTA